MFNRYYTSESNPDEAPDPLKRGLKNKKSRGSLTDHLEAGPAETQDIDMSPVTGQGSDTRPVEKQGATMRPAAKQGAKQKPVASLPMSITGQLPRPLGKVAAIHAIRPLKWYDECETTDLVRATLRRGHSYTKILRDRGEPNRRDTLTQW